MGRGAFVLKEHPRELLGKAGSPSLPTREANRWAEARENKSAKSTQLRCAGHFPTRPLWKWDRDGPSPSLWYPSAYDPLLKFAGPAGCIPARTLFLSTVYIADRAGSGSQCRKLHHTELASHMPPFWGDFCCDPSCRGFVRFRVGV